MPNIRLQVNDAIYQYLENVSVNHNTIGEYIRELIRADIKHNDIQIMTNVPLDSKQRAEIGRAALGGIDTYTSWCAATLNRQPELRHAIAALNGELMAIAKMQG